MSSPRSNSLRASLALLLLLLPGGCQWFQLQTDPQAPPTVQDDPIFGPDPLPAMRKRLLAMERESNTMRTAIDFEQPDREKLRELIRTERQHGVELQQLVKRQGWPTTRLVGSEASRAAWRILTRAEFQPLLQAELLKTATPHVGTDIAPDAYALLLDRTEIARGLPQTYGTQFRVLSQGGEQYLQLAGPIADPLNLDQRRAEMGLVPHANYVAQLQLQLRGQMPDNFVETAPSINE